MERGMRANDMQDVCGLKGTRGLRNGPGAGSSRSERLGERKSDE